MGLRTTTLSALLGLAAAVLSGCASRAAAPASSTTPPAAAAAADPTAAQLRERGEALLFRALDPAAAIAVFEQLRELAPGEPEPYATLAFLYVDAQRLDEARAAADTLVALRPGVARPLDVRAEIRLLCGDLDGAAAGFHEALALDPDFFEARAGLAAIHGYRGAWDEALAELEEAFADARTDETRQRARLAIGWAQLAAGRSGPARDTLQQATAAVPRLASVIAIELAIELGRWQEAADAAEAAVVAERALATAPAGEQSRISPRWIHLLHALAASRQGDLGAAAAQVSALEAGAASLDPWITKDLTMARGFVALARRDIDLAVASFTDRWVLNHRSLYDPGRAAAGPSLDHFALQGRLLAAEALLLSQRSGDAARGRALLEQLAATHHRSLGAVVIHHEARARLDKLDAAPAPATAPAIAPAPATAPALDPAPAAAPAPAAPAPADADAADEAPAEPELP